MFFNLSKAFVALAAVTAAAASAVPATGGTTFCTLTLKPNIHVDAQNVDLGSEFSFVVGVNLFTQTRDVNNGNINASGAHVVQENPDDTFVISETLGVPGLTAAETAAIITGWLGETKQGFATNWFVQAVTCT